MGDAHDRLAGLDPDRLAQLAPAELPYLVIHASVDGAGVSDRFATLDEATAYAEERQRLADERGNPYRYAFSVHRRGRVLHRTTPAPQPPPVRHCPECGEPGPLSDPAHAACRRKAHAEADDGGGEW